MGKNATRRQARGSRWPSRLGLGLTLGLAVMLAASSGWAQDQGRTVKRIIDLNRKALIAVESKDFAAARDHLLRAVAMAKEAELADHKMTARTFVHLGSVFLLGFDDKAKARRFFSMAKSIRADIQLTPRLSTPELEAAFDEAPAVVDAPGTSPEQALVVPEPTFPGPTSAGDDGEPDLPTTFPRPLYCPAPGEVIANEDVVLRCAVEPGLKVDRVLIFYRPEGATTFSVGALQVSPKGWFDGAIPGDVIAAGILQYFFEARDVADNVVANDGREDGPNLLTVKAVTRRTGRTRISRGAGTGSGDDPLGRIKDEHDREAFLAGLHRRDAGAIIFNLGAGSAAGWHPAAKLEWNSNYSVRAGTAPAGVYTVFPEIGYMFTDSFGILVQGRFEKIQQEGSGETRVRGKPATGAWAVLLRGMWAVGLGGGNLQLLLSGNVGWGPGGAGVRFQVPPTGKMVENPDTGELEPSGTLVTDTVPGGGILYGPGLGFMYNFTRWFGLAIELRGLGAGPHLALVGEGWASLQFSLPTRRRGGAAVPELSE